ncbi:MAG: ribonuclease HII, partial [Acidobacteriota bacterium]
GICLDFEIQARSEGFQSIAGVDEVGRGCLAGPVVAAACILDPGRELPKGLNDSKKLTAARRSDIAAELKETAIAYAVGQVEADEIDLINILEATKRAMISAIGMLSPAADLLLIDAVRLHSLSLPQRSIIKGDSISASIAAASVIAKTFRDELMTEYDAAYPEFGFRRHVGYGTREHFAALREHGPCPLHRRTFRGVVIDDCIPIASDGKAAL